MLQKNALYILIFIIAYPATLEHELQRHHSYIVTISKNRICTVVVLNNIFLFWFIQQTYE